MSMPSVRELGHLLVAVLAHVHEMVERAAHPLAHRVLDEGAEIEGEPLEALAVVPLEQLGHQDGGGVLLEVRRVVAHADLAAARARRDGAQRRLLPRGRAQRGARELQLERGRVAQGDHVERVHAVLAPRHGLFDERDAGIQAAPVAHGRHGFPSCGSAGPAAPGGPAPRGFQLLQCLWKAPVLLERAHLEAGLGQLRLDAQGLVEAGECLLVLLQSEIGSALVGNASALPLQRQHPDSCRQWLR